MPRLFVSLAVVLTAVATPGARPSPGQAIKCEPTEGEAYHVVSQGGHSRIANVVDLNYTVAAKFPTHLLPPKRVK